jgi:hypothetical protein
MPSTERLDNVDPTPSHALHDEKRRAERGEYGKKKSRSAARESGNELPHSKVL